LSGNLAFQQRRTADHGTLPVFGVEISDLTGSDAQTLLLGDMASRRHRKVAFCNAHTANLSWGDTHFRAALSGFTVLADGIGVDIAAQILHGRRFAANLNGTDFVPALLRGAPQPVTIAMMGARPDVVDKAAAALRAFDPRHIVRTTLHGFADDVDTAAFLADLAREPVDVLLVAMGNPRQERWIADRVSQHHATLAIGVGALFDFLAGEVTRAPRWVRNWRLEWLYRLAQEPTRLFRRYVLGNPLFLMRVIMVKLGLRRLG
jgi:exopolysaccharide biosynthesis WecB/TagA/CpsF family protein